jgi:hypothetical protein
MYCIAGHLYLFHEIFSRVYFLVTNCMYIIMIFYRQSQPIYDLYGHLIYALLLFITFSFLTLSESKCLSHKESSRFSLPKLLFFSNCMPQNSTPLRKRVLLLIMTILVYKHSNIEGKEDPINRISNNSNVPP